VAPAQAGAQFNPWIVAPAQAGAQFCKRNLDPGLRREDFSFGPRRDDFSFGLRREDEAPIASHYSGLIPHYLLPVAAAHPLSMSAFFAAAALTSSGRTCGATGILSATLSGSFIPGTEGRTKPCAKMACPMSVMMKLSHSFAASGFGPLSTRLIAYGAAAEASLGITTATASPSPSVYFALSPSFS